MHTGDLGPKETLIIDKSRLPTTPPSLPPLPNNFASMSKNNSDQQKNDMYIDKASMDIFYNRPEEKKEPTQVLDNKNNFKFESSPNDITNITYPTDNNKLTTQNLRSDTNHISVYDNKSMSQTMPQNFKHDLYSYDSANNTYETQQNLNLPDLNNQIYDPQNFKPDLHHIYELTNFDLSNIDKSHISDHKNLKSDIPSKAYANNFFDPTTRFNNNINNNSQHIKNLPNKSNDISRSMVEKGLYIIDQALSSNQQAETAGMIMINKGLEMVSQGMNLEGMNGTRIVELGSELIDHGMELLNSYINTIKAGTSLIINADLIII